MKKTMLIILSVLVCILVLCGILLHRTASPPVVKVHSFDGSGQVFIKWEAMKDVDGYAVYRSSTEEGTYELIKTCDGDKRQYTDTNRKVGQKLYYKVCSYTLKDGKKTYGDKSEAAEIQVKKAMENDPEDVLMLVNKKNWLSSSYVPSKLVSLGSLAIVDIEAKEEVREAYEKLYRDAQKAGFDIKVISAYRDYDLQVSLFDYWCKVDGLKQALRTSAKAGRSEHQTGYALDVSCEELNWDLLERFGNTAEGKWLGENAHKYGFIVRYGKDTEAITGYAYEPWHIRYVGEKAAKEIFEQNITLEEYLGYF